MPITLIGLDADDTLWHNETIFRDVHARFNDLLADYASPQELQHRLEQVEIRNLGLYGYGAKGFTLSMIEAALEASEACLPADTLTRILALGREMMAHPVEPLPGVADALEALAVRGSLVLITKGDLFHQEAKLAGSGLGGHFSGVEIVSAKTPDTYAAIFRRHRTDPRARTDGGQFGALRHPAAAGRRRVGGAGPLPAGVEPRGGGCAGRPPPFQGTGRAGGTAGMDRRDRMSRIATRLLKITSGKCLNIRGL